MAGAGGQTDDRAQLWTAEVLAQRAAARAEAFGYVCNRCSLCCWHKIIQVNPYEVARLAQRLGVGTAEFRERWTQDGLGAHLTRTEDDSCSFLGPEGCTVHQDRPLVCRIYPLGRHVAADGTEAWSHVEPHPQTKGVYSTQGTVGDYVTTQGALPFMQAADEYASWIRRAYERLEALADGDDEEAAQAADLLDIDAMISAHCGKTGETEPLDIEARKALHLSLLAGWLDNMQESA